MTDNWNGLDDFSGHDVAEGLASVNSVNDLPHKEKDELELDDRNKIYTNILTDYETYIKKTLSNNNHNKTIFLWTFTIILSLVTIGALIMFLYAIFKPQATHILTLITAAVSFISAIIIIPGKMAEYLFNPQETEHINEIIKNIQDYDKAVREDLFKRDNENET